VLSILRWQAWEPDIVPPCLWQHFDRVMFLRWLYERGRLSEWGNSLADRRRHARVWEEMRA